MKQFYFVCLLFILGWTAQAQQTWYAINSGDWNNPENWTLDPAAAVYVTADEGYPLSGDNAVIKSGKTITMPTDDDSFIANCNVLTVDGRLDLKNTSGHLFTEIRGSGRIIMESDNFPAGDASHFINEGKGTVVFKGENYNISSNTFYNVEIDLANTGSVITLAGNLTVNGDFSVLKGSFCFGNNSTSRSLTVKGDVIVSSGASMTVYTTNAAHYLYVWGNIINNGTIRLTNLSNPDYDSTPTNGYVILTVKGESNNTLQANNTTFLQRLIIDKGDDPTWRFTVNPSQRQYFRLFGQNNNDTEDKALYIKNGTLELTGATYIHSLTEGTNDFYVPQSGGLWINGSAVEVNTTADDANADGLFTADGVNTAANEIQSLSVLGKFRITDGTLNTRTHGFVVWDTGNALVLIEGGTIYTPGFRSAGDNTGKWTYNQSGGSVYMYGDIGSDLSGSGAATFSVKGENNVFIMTGGTMEIQDAATSANRAIEIESGEGKYSVTGGTIRINQTGSASENFNISSTAPFYNLEITGQSNTATAILNSELTILNDLTIGTNGTLNVSDNNYALKVGGDLTLQQNTSNIELGNSVTTFFGEGVSQINNYSGGDLIFGNLTVSKSSVTDEVVLNAGNAKVNGLLFVEKGNLNLDDNILSVYGNISLKKGNVLTSDGKLVLAGSSLQTIYSDYGHEYGFGNVELNNTSISRPQIELLSNITISTLHFAAGQLVHTGAYNLKITQSLTKASGVSWGANAAMFRTNGLSSDGGLTLPVRFSGNKSDELIQTFPVGVLDNDNTRYTPAMVYAKGNNLNVDGFITINPVNDYHPAFSGEGSEYALNYYWCAETDELDGEENNLRYDFVLDEVIDVPYFQSIIIRYDPEGIVITKGDYDTFGVNVLQDDERTLAFPYSANLSEDFTYAVYDAYYLFFKVIEEPRTFYSRKSGNWNERDTWSFDGHNGRSVRRRDFPPGPEDIVIIGDNDSVYITGNGAEAAQITIENGSVLDIGSTVNHNFSEIKGSGKFRISSGNVPDANFGEFVTNDTAIFEYYGDDNYTLSNQLDQYPNLVISGSGTKTVANVDIKAKGLLVDDAPLIMSSEPNGDVVVEKNVVINTGNIQFGNSGTARAMTIKGNLTFTGAGSILVDEAGTDELEHNLTIFGDIIQNDGVVDLYNDNNNVNTVTVTFAGDGSSLFSKTGDENTRLGYVVVDKAETDSVTFAGEFTLNAPNDEVRKPLTLNSGIVSLDHPNINLELSAGGGLFKIPSTAELVVNQGQVSLGGNDADEGGLWLDGKLTINDGGVSRFDQGTNNFIEYTASGRSEIEVNGSGELHVGSQIRRSPNTEAGILSFSVNSSEAVVEVGINGWGESSRAVFEILNPGSSFSMADGATLTIHNSKAPGLADLYFDPETISLGDGSTINIVEGSETGTFDIYANQPVENLSLTGAVEVRLQTLPLVLKGDLNIGESATFNANGLDLTIRGNMINQGSFVPNENTTYFSGTQNQSIRGNTTFYNLVKNGGNLTLQIAENTEIVVENDLTLSSGSVHTGENELMVKGDVTIADAASVQSGDSGNGMVLNGSASQQLSGGGAIARLMIDNPSGVVIPTQSAATTITDVLKLNNGILDIGRNLLVLGEDAHFAGDDTDNFSATNMVQTNLSFTDAGIMKYLPAGAMGEFTFPLGSSGKYTPVVMNVTANGRAGGGLRVKAANEPHITIPAEDLDNVLQYNWTLDAEGIEGFSATVAMHGHPDDVPGTNAEDYITARILDEQAGIWNKFSTDDFDEENTILYFRFDGTNDAGIDGDYTAGTDDAIPDKVQTFVTINNGYWDEPSTWSVVGGGEVPDGGPKGAIVNIKHQVEMRTNGHEAYITNLTQTGALGVGSTLNHRLGKVNGTGRIILESGSVPAGDYTEFLSAEGGTLEFAGTSNYSVLSEMPQVNNLVFSGEGQRILPNIDLKVLGDLTIDGGTVINEENRLLTLYGDLSRNDGIFDMRQGDVKLKGDKAQTINGDFTGSSDFYNLTVDNLSGITLNGPVEVTNVLTFVNGIINTADDALLTVLNAGNSAVAGASNLRYVNGPMQKHINAGTTFDFPVGDDYRYGNIGVRPQSTGVWTVQYFDHAASEDGYSDDGVTFVSHSEYWRVEANSADNARVVLRWDGESGINPDDSNFMVISYEDEQWNEVDYSDKWGDINGGKVITVSVEHNTRRLFTFGLKSIEDFTWIGSNGTDWFDGANWEGGVVPSVANPVLIKSGMSANNPVIPEDQSAWCSSLTIDAGKTLTLKPGSSLDITEDVINNGTIVIESTNDNLASLMLPETMNQSGLVNVKLTLEANGKWYLSAPLKDPTAGKPLVEWFYPDNDATNDWVYILRDPNGDGKDTWERVNENGVNGDPLLNDMENVAAWYKQEKVLDYSGYVYESEVQKTFNGKGYYMIGNPYLTAIDWDNAEGWERDGISNTMWSFIDVNGGRVLQTYNSGTGVYTIFPEGYDESTLSHIPPYQSVWVKTEKTNARLTVKPSARVSKSEAPLKSIAPNTSYNLIRIEAGNGYLIDGAVIYFNDDFSVDAGPEDSEKQFNSSTSTPEIYTRINDVAYAINGLPELDADSLDIPLSVRNRIEGEVTLKFYLERFADGYELYLIDGETGVRTNLRQQNKYVYTPADMGDDHDRFVLRFVKVNEVPTSVEEPGENTSATIRIVGRQTDALVKISRELLQTAQATIDVLDLNGRLIKSVKTNLTETEIDLPENSGIYLIRVEAGGTVKSEKIMRVLNQ